MHAQAPFAIYYPPPSMPPPHLSSSSNTFIPQEAHLGGSRTAEGQRIFEVQRFDNWLSIDLCIPADEVHWSMSMRDGSTMEYRYAQNGMTIVRMRVPMGTHQ